MLMSLRIRVLTQLFFSQEQVFILYHAQNSMRNSVVPSDLVFHCSFFEKSPKIKCYMFCGTPCSYSPVQKNASSLANPPTINISHLGDKLSNSVSNIGVLEKKSQLPRYAGLVYRYKISLIMFLVTCDRIHIQSLFLHFLYSWT